jgi:hypothetical protein
MPVWSRLLRVALCVILMLNGVASAMASVQMEAAHVQAAADIERMASTTDVMPCHQGGELTATSVVMQDAVQDGPGSGHAKHPDCCKSSTCRCACLFSAQAAVPSWVAPPAVVAHTRSVRPLSLGHAQPTLPHLIRPPIV